MLARIETIEQLSSAIRLMQTGQVALQFGLLFILFTLGLSAAAIWRKDERLAHAARRAQYALFALTAFCCVLLYVGIFNGYYFVGYVQHVTENNEEFAFKISALWASQQGSLLFWCFILTGFSATFAFTQRHNRTDRRLPYVLLVLSVVQFFFFFIITSPSDMASFFALEPSVTEAAQRSSPFALSYNWLLGATLDEDKRLLYWHGTLTVGEAMSKPGFRGPNDMIHLIQQAYLSGGETLKLAEIHRLILTDPAALSPEVQRALLDQCTDGNGMNPALHNYWVAIHPPMLYLGFVGLTVPFAYAVGSLLAGEVGEGWLRPIRLWTMAAWGFLTIGIALGGLWAYEILGWGGYWAWDPVENASFIPWLTGTAFIHSVIVTERRGILRMWSFALIIITYCMTVIGTFLVRSGIINSVHAFGATGDVDVWFYGFLGIVLIGSLLAVVWRYPLLKPDRRLENIVSREGSFLLNNLALIAIALVTLVITFWPVITRNLYGLKEGTELGPDAFIMINIPLFLLTLILMGIGPSLAWHRNSGRQLVRAFTAPVAAAIVVGIVNTIWLVRGDLLIELGRDDTIANAAAAVRLGVQLTLWPISAFTFTCIVMEFFAGARARSRSTRENLPVAMLKVSLANRRRYGGYIVHIGVLLIALGIYYSSFYESEGTVIARPGGYSVLADKLSGNQWLVVYDDQTRTEGWDAVQEIFARDPERAAVYENMLRFVRQNPDKDANALVAMQRATFDEQFGSEWPPQLQQAFPRMAAALIWGANQRDRKVVYERFDSSLHIFPYSSPAQLATEPYLKTFGEAQRLAFTAPEGVASEVEAGQLLASMFVRAALQTGAQFPAEWAASRARLAGATDAEFARQSQLEGVIAGLSPEKVAAIRKALTSRLDEVERALKAASEEGVLLGAEQAHVHKLVLEQAGRQGDGDFAQTFGLDVDERDFLARRFEIMQRLEQLTVAMEAFTVETRNRMVVNIAMNLPGDEAQQSLVSLRPLSLAGLRIARKECDALGMSNIVALLDAEIDVIVDGAMSLKPGMRVFYDKRTGAPRAQEAIKDPAIHRRVSGDFYFILQDVRQDGTGTFRFFVKPQMLMGLSGLTIIALGTVMAFLPTMRRRRKA